MVSIDHHRLLLHATGRRKGALYGFAPAPEHTAARKSASRIFPALKDWWPIAERAGVTDEITVGVAAMSERNDTSFAAEVVALGLVSEELLSQAIADELGLVMQADIPPETLVLPDQQAAALLCSASPTLLVKSNNGAEAHFLVATERIGDLTRQVSLFPDIARRLRVSPLTVLRSALTARVSDHLARIATFDLITSHPAYSAGTIVNAWQGCVLGALAIALPMAVWVWPAVTFGVLHVVFTLFFLSCVALRFAALAGGGQQKQVPASKPPPADLPIYSVLVALYKEADVVGDLVAALRRIDWPVSKLDIKFVCEADDTATITAIHAARPPAYMQVVSVPDFGPRTKPKALNYALQTRRGEFVVLYDAEDKPHPGQLLEAWSHFQKSDVSVGCLQAPLDVANAGHSWIARMFAFEYAALFRGLLPWLSAHRLLLPLGGTSNHFRRSALEEVGRWDPFNVTEDADLGARLLRFGYRAETILLPTAEDGPETARIWVPQRTRWFKGWCLLCKTLAKQLFHNENFRKWRANRHSVPTK